MSDTVDQHASRFLLTVTASQLAQAAKSASGAPWRFEPAPVKDAALLPAIDAPVRYQLAFQGGLHGALYLTLARADVALLTGRPKTPSEQNTAPEDTVADALRALIESLCAALPDACAGKHGQLRVQAEPCEELDPAAEQIYLLNGSDGAAGVVTLLLHLDPLLAASIAAAGVPVAPESGSRQAVPAKANLDLVLDVELNCTLRFGQRQLSLREILELASGSVIELDRQVDEPVELILDGKVIARGEAVIIDGNYGLRVTQVVQHIAF